MEFVRLFINLEKEKMRNIFVLSVLFSLLFSNVLLSKSIKNFNESILCQDGKVLLQSEQLGLYRVQGKYHVMYMDEQKRAETFTMIIDTPGAFEGTEFPKNVCASEVILNFSNGNIEKGVLKYEPSEKHFEHRGADYHSLIVNNRRIIKFVFNAYDGGIYIIGNFEAGHIYGNIVKFFGWRAP